MERIWTCFLNSVLQIQIKGTVKSGAVVLLTECTILKLDALYRVKEYTYIDNLGRGDVSALGAEGMAAFEFPRLDHEIQASGAIEFTILHVQIHLNVSDLVLIILLQPICLLLPDVVVD